MDSRFKDLAYLQNISSFPTKYIEERQEFSQKYGSTKLCKKVPKTSPKKIEELRARFAHALNTKPQQPNALPSIQPKKSLKSVEVK
jgi:hypothetical protein